MMRQSKVVLAALLVAMMVLAAPVNAYQAPTFQSDEFNPCGPLDVWTTTATVSGQSVTSNRTQLILTAAPGPNQTISEDANDQLVYNVARVIQPFGGTGGEDFGIEVKFDSNVTQQYQQQGIVVEAGAGNLLRFEFFYSNSEKTVLYANRVYTQGAGTIRQDFLRTALGDLTSAQSLYMRVSRTGGVWALDFKTDTTDWPAAPTPLPVQPPANTMVSGVGVYSGTSARPNDGTQAPGHTAIVDYFFNTASPIANGDAASNKLTVNVVGEGSVVLTPEQPEEGYACGTSVQLQANSTEPWYFARWEGAISSVINPQNITMNGGDQTVTAVFENTPQPQFDKFILIPLIRNND